MLALIAALVLVGAIHVSAKEPPAFSTLTPIIPIPEPVEPLETDDAIQNILLLGADTSTSQMPRTDVMIVVSINRRVGSVALWHVPRDLFVYIPATVDTSILVHQIGSRDGGRTAFQLLRRRFSTTSACRRPLCHGHFTDFERIITLMGRLTISVDCALRDWRLIDPTSTRRRRKLAVYAADRAADAFSDMALWYVRSRQSTSDFDRGRRQMDVLRAMWQQARAEGLFEQLTTLGPERWRSGNWS